MIGKIKDKEKIRNYIKSAVSRTFYEIWEDTVMCLLKFTML